MDRAWKTPQFWLLWAVLCLNVSAGIGIVGMASPMMQEVFGDGGWQRRTRARRRLAQVATGAGSRSAVVFNIVGRIFWASLSDLHRPARDLRDLLRARHSAVRAASPLVGSAGALGLFVAIFCML